MLLLSAHINSAKVSFNHPSFSEECVSVFKNVDRLTLSKIPLKCKLTKKIQLWRKLRKHELSFEEGVRFLQENPHWPLRPETIPELEKKITSKTQTSVVRRWFLTNPPTTAQGLLSFVTTLSIQELKEKRYKGIIQTFWHTKHLSAIDQTIILNKLGFVLSAIDHQKRIEFLLWNNQCSSASRLLMYIPKQKQAVYMEWSKLLKSRTKASTQNLSHPGIATEAAVHAMKQTLYSKAGYYLLGVAPKRVFNFGNSFYKAHLKAIRNLINIKQYRLAYKLAVRGTQLTSKHKLFREEFEWLSGWILIEFLKQPKNSIKHLTQAASLTQNSRKISQYFFWLSKAAQAARMNNKKREWLEQASQYPHTFYGQLAAKELNCNINIQSPRLSQSTINHFLRRDIVKAIQFAHDAKQETVKYVLINALQNNLNTLAEYTAGFYFTKQYATPYYTIHYYEKVNKHINFSSPDVFFSIKADFQSLFNKHFMHAMIFNESRFNPTIKSGRGALGLMQITPLTGKHLTRKGFDFNEQKLHQDPIYNLKMGAAYLKELFNRFNQSYTVVAAAYNAGPTYISQWIRKKGYPKSSFDYKWIERLEYPETRDYVKKIMAAMLLYKTHSHKLPTYSTQQLLQFYLNSR